MNDKIKNYIAFHDSKIKNAKLKRDKTKRSTIQNSLNETQKKKLLFLLSYIKSHPSSALNNKEKLNEEIKKILSDR